MRVLVLFVTVLLAVPALGADLDIVVAPTDEPLQAGEHMIFSVYFHNAEEYAVPVDLPERVTCRLMGAGKTMEVAADSLEPPAKPSTMIEGKSFLKATYVLTLPPSLEGPTRLEVGDFDGASVLVSVLASKAPQAEDEEEVETDLPSFDAVAALYQPYLINLSAYEPMYLLVGTDPEKSKFQISFKYRFLDPKGRLAEKVPWLKGFHFAYTQTSFWDLKSSSRPFEDTSYKPELFFLTTNLGTPLQWVHGLFLQAGFQHESNGRGGDASRSTNYVYAKPILVFYDEDRRLGLMVAPKVWAYVANDSDTNPDLEQYRGYFDLELKFGKADSVVVGTHLRWAEQGASVQADFTYPISRLLFDSLDLYFHFQYVNALAESLIDYKERTEAFRLGFSIVR
jgi:outer membrane phospholipase A